MPVYVYRCANCEHEFEKIQKFSDDPIKICPECDQEAVKKVITPAGIIFKGSGWYINDSKSKKNNLSTTNKADTAGKVNDVTKDSSTSSSESGAKSASSDSSGSTSKSESKPAKSASKSD